MIPTGKEKGKRPKKEVIPGKTVYQLNSMLNLATTQIHAVDTYGVLSIRKREKSILEILVTNPPADAKITQVQENSVKARGAVHLQCRHVQKQTIQRKRDGEKASGCHHFLVHKLGFSGKP